jgi:hypothetical protein
MQVLPANVMVDAIDTAFEKREITLNCVRRDTESLFITHVFIRRMVHERVLL